MVKAFELGITVGRFQTFHNGHKAIIDKALELCEKVGIFIGSSQESGTNKNPFTYEMRESILRKIYGDSIDVFPLPDIGVGNNSKWGDYVLENIYGKFNRYPDILISGKESRRVDWFDGIEGISVYELYIPKSIDISASKLREMMINDDFELWKKYTDEKIWDSFFEMRNIVLLSKDNIDSSSL